MEQKKKRGRKSKSDQQILEPLVKDGVVEGNYSKAVWKNNELLSFDIDWDKLSKYMKKVS